MTNKKIGIRIRQLRKYGSMSQTKLAEIISLNQQAVSKIEKGTQKISLMESVKLEQYFGPEWWRTVHY